MDVTDLILADYATTSERGKFTLVGAGFTEMSANQTPYTHPLMFLFLRFRVRGEDEGQNRVEVRIVRENKFIFKADADLGVKSKEMKVKQIPISIRLVNLKFPEEGEYEIQVHINGEVKQTQLLYIKKVEKK